VAIQGPWLLAAALELLADGVDDATATARLVSAARGNRESLRGAYARALALAGELPEDVTARRAVELLTRAMRGQFDPRLPVHPAADSAEDLGEHGHVFSAPDAVVAPRRLRIWEQPVGGVSHGVH
jgi:hypothetical protein